MSHEESEFEHRLIHDHPHAGRVRIVDAADTGEARAELNRLFPRESVYTAPMGCSHVCVYTGTAPASLVAECMDEHAELVEHRSLHPVQRP